MSSQTLIREAADGNLARVKAIIDTGAVHVDVSDKKGHSTLFAAAVSIVVIKTTFSSVLKM